MFCPRRLRQEGEYGYCECCRYRYKVTRTITGRMIAWEQRATRHSRMCRHRQAIPK